MDTDPAAPETPTTASLRQRLGRTGLHALRGLGWFGHWLPGALIALLLAAGLAAWLWAGTPGSLAQALGWAQGWMQNRANSTGVLHTTGVEGSVREGGRIQGLQWSRNGLEVQAQGVHLRWNAALLADAVLGRGLRLEQLDIEHLVIDDRRAPRPSAPPESLTLPLPVSLAWSLGQLELTGHTRLTLARLSGHYRYGPADAAARQTLGAGTPLADVHQLTVHSLQLAQGRYRLQATLGALAPLPLHLALQGEVQASVPSGHRLTLQATAHASGTLAGQSATLAVAAQVQPSTGQGTATLSAQAEVRPWAAQPLHAVDATAHRLDLALLWPQAPTTDLSGTVRAQPVGQAWHAQLDLRNGLSGPWDRQRLPVDHLQAALELRDGDWQLSSMQARLGRAQLQASGTFQPPRASASAQWLGQLQAQSLNPAQLWSTFAPAALDASLSARSAATRPGQAPAIALDARVQPASQITAPTGQQGLRLRELRLLGQWRPAQGGGVLQMDEAVIDAAQVRLTGQGTLDLEARRFTGQAALQWPGAQGHFDGTLAHRDGRGNLTLRVDDAAQWLGWLRGLQSLPVLGPPLRARLDQQPALRDLQVSGQASLAAQWTGGLAELGVPAPRSGAPQATVPLRLQATLTVPRLDVSTPGTASASWSLRQAELQASGSLGLLSVRLRGEAEQTPWRATLQAQGQLQRAWPLPAAGGGPGRLELDSLRLVASHNARSDRVVEWSLNNVQPLTLKWRHTADGPMLHAEPGQLLLQPTLRGNDAAAARAFGTTPLTLAWDSLAWQAGALQTRGRLSGLPLSWVDTLASAEGAVSGPITQAGVSGDLLFDGDWDLMLPLRPGPPLRLTARLQRRSGDLTVQADGASETGTRARSANGLRLQAGVREASLSLDAQGQAVQARLRWDSERLGQASADLGTELATLPAASGNALDRWWPASAPLRGTLRAQLPEVGVWSTLAPPGWRVRGTLQADATLSGTRSAPQWSGTLQADQLALRSVVDGFAFSNGVLRATLAGERITIDRFELQGAQGGTLSATGQAQWRLVDGQRQPLIDLQATARQLRVSSRADRRLTLSGQVTTQLAGPRLQIRGKLRADAALFVLPDEATPALSTDVVVRGGRNLAPGTPTVAQVQPDVSVDLDLGPQFDVRVRGLQARLTGQLNLRSTPAQPEPRVFGEVRTTHGSYRAYGQQLTIENGMLTFNGPYDDPALDILAIRPLGSNATQRVGVQINGSAQSPQVRLVATPDLPDAEKLAWLVLGRPATGAGAEAAVLQQAALALLGGNDGRLDGGLARALGLDELSYRGEGSAANGNATTAAITLGKRLSSELYVSYETSLVGAMGTVSIFYDVSRRFTLRARAGEENALDLIFKLRYD